MGLPRLMLTAALAALPASAQANCPELAAADGKASAEGYTAAFRTDPAEAAPLAPFALDLVVCGPEGPFAGPLQVDADMPAHRHGMNYTPEVRNLGHGRYRASGMLFHMPGRWRFKFDLATEAGPVRLRADFDLR